MKQIRSKKAHNPPTVKSLDKQNWKLVPTISDYKKLLEDIFINPTTFWSTCSVRAAIDAHDVGNFSQSGRLVDYMMRDPRIFACCNTLVYGILGLPFSWKWPEDYKPSKEDKKYLEVLNIWWKQFMSTSAPITMMKWVANMGFCILGKAWNLEYLHCTEDELGKLYIPTIEVFHPSNCIYNTATRQYVTFTSSHGSPVVEECDPRLQIVRHVDSERPFMQGAVRSLGLVWLDKWMAESDWRSYLSLFGNPLRILTTDREYSTPGGAGEFDIEAFVRDMATALAYGAPVHLMKEESLNLLQANSSNADVFKDKIEDDNKEIAIVYLGQNLTTDSGTKGSYANAKVHDNVRQDYIEAYTTTLNHALFKIVKEFYYFNFPDNLIVPEPYFNPEIPSNELEIEKIKGEKAKSMKEISDSLDKLSNIIVDGQPLINQINIKALLDKYY